MTRSDARPIRASAPGKIIILGEHFVVHDSLAISAAINKRASVLVWPSADEKSIVSYKGTRSYLTKDDHKFVAVKSVARKAMKDFEANERVHIEIESELPPGSGLGSSAAVSVATAAAMLEFFGVKANQENVLKLASPGEAAVHGNASGIDIATSYSGGAILFNRTKGFEPIQTTKQVQFLVVFSNTERNTSELIQKVSSVRDSYPSTFGTLVQSISRFCELGVEAIQKHDLPLLGSLMNLSQTALDWIGVSNSSIEKLIEKINSAGPCYGVKITGAGGGGSVIALPGESSSQKTASTLSQEYRHTFLTDLSQEGLKIDD